MRSYDNSSPAGLDWASASHQVQTDPDYQTRVSQGIPLAQLPYSFSITKSKTVSWEFFVKKYKWGQFYGQTNLGALSGYVPDTAVSYKVIKGMLESSMQDFINLKTNKLLSKIKSQSLPLLMLYKERKQTGQLVLGFLQKVVDFAKFAKRRQWKKALRVYGVGSSSRPARLYISRMKKWENRTSIVGNAWLQARFAWMPLYHDIKDSIMAAYEYESKIHTFTNRVGQFTEVSAEYFETGEHPWIGTRQIHFSMVVNYAISDVTLAAAGSMMDLPTTLWDSVPYSFVIDRIINVSQYLDLQNATMGTQFTSGCQTVFYIDSIFSPPAGVVDWYPDRYTYLLVEQGREYFHQGDKPTRTDVRMDRTIMSSFPVPKLLFPLKNSFVQGVDLAFLGLQVKRRLSSRL